MRQGGQRRRFLCFPLRFGGDNLDALLIDDSFDGPFPVLDGSRLAESSPLLAGGDAAVDIREAHLSKG